ncbi:MAG TPA: MBL fold metallo-hydrolase [Chthoniobacterales bacterium]|jgi:glyoxylase-like metal-dependent hydrolase (beta-lactamase superfamily II)|nr:MBL fold metallo-hydrolase [Chthoniobacterales bacterium]
MAIPLEDNVSDIIGKAQRGLGISDSQLAERAGVSTDAVRKVRNGDLTGDAVERVAPILKLNAAALRKLAAGEWKPEEIGDIDGLAMFNTTYGDITVNAYLVWDPATRDAVAFDTGANCSAMLKRIEDEKLKTKLILLTHAHPDHVADLTRLRKATGAPVYISEREPEEGAEPIPEGKHFKVGALAIEARLTSGHSPGGITYVVTGLAQPIAIVGDSLFAGSMGGGNVSYQDALRNNREKILTLPDETIVCPGHGPLTTVGKEKRDNPFFVNVDA